MELSLPAPGITPGDDYAPLARIGAASCLACKPVATTSEANDRLVPSHREADPIKGAGNRSAVGTLMERTTRLLMLDHMSDASTASALAGFTAALNQVSEPLRKTPAYDQGWEMQLYRQLTERTGVQVYFCDPHSPWQR